MKNFIYILLTFVSLSGFAQPTDYVVFYPMDGNMNDESGNGYHGTGQNLSGVSDRFGDATSAYEFFGTNSYFFSSHTFTNNQPLTVSVWVNWDGTAGDQTIVSWFDNTLTSRMFLGVNGSGHLIFGDGFQTGTTLESERWVHLVGTYDGSQSRLYINGEQSDVSSTGLTYQFDNLTIGRQGSNATEYWDGKIDGVKVYERAIDATEVSNLYMEGGYDANLVAQYSFSGNYDDNGGNALHGTANGNTSLTADRFGDTNSAVLFGGADGFVELPTGSMFRSSTEGTISGWINMTSNPANANYLFGNGELNLGVNSQGRAIVTVQYSPGSNLTISHNSSGLNVIPLNEWVHVAGSYDGSTLRAYVNGELVAEASQAGYITELNAANYIGRYSNVYSAASIDDIRIYDRTLSLEELEEIYHENDWAIASPPVISSVVPMNGPVGTEATIIGANFDGTPSNNIVYFGSVEATVTSASETQLVVTVPVGATYAPITINSNELQVSSKEPFVVTFASSGLDNGSFGTASTYNVGEHPYGIATGDFDGDGKTDVVNANYVSYNISVFRNTSTGSGDVAFDTRLDFATNTFPWGVDVGDLDGDGKLDIAVSVRGSSLIAIFHNISIGVGDINFDTQITFATSANPEGIVIGDLDNDGKPDIATVSITNDVVSVFRNASSGSGDIFFDSEVTFATGDAPHDVTMADLDNDGLLDLAVASDLSTISVFRNTSSGSGNINFDTRIDHATGSQPFFVEASDLDADGKIDLAASVYGPGYVAVFRNASTGVGDVGLESQVTFSAGNGTRSLAIADLDGDGKPDIATSNTVDQTFSILRNISESSINFETSIDFSPGASTREIALADMDGDEKPDVITTHAQTNGFVAVSRNVTTESTPGLVADYPLNDNANDLSGNGNHGSLGDGSTATTFPSADINRFGTGASAYYFDGGDYIVIPDNATLSSSDFTVSAWVKTSQIDGVDYRVLTKTDGSTENYSLSINSGFARISFTSATGTQSVTSNSVINNGNWNHLSASYNSTSNILSIYVNGVLENTLDAGSDPDTNVGELFIGAFGTTSNYFEGIIDDIQIYNYELSETDILDLYTVNDYYAQIYLYGNATNNTLVELSNISDIAGYDNIHMGAVNFSNGFFRFWGTQSGSVGWGDNDINGIAGRDENEIEVTQGMKAVRFNTSSLEYQINDIGSVGFIGSALTGYDNGWWPVNEVIMEDLGNGVYQIPFIELFNGAWKVRANGNWADINWGSEFNDGVLKPYAADVEFSAGQGFYKITVDLINKTYAIDRADGLIAYYKIHTDFNDYSGNDLHATQGVQDVGISSDRFENTGGEEGFSVTLDGIDDYLIVNHNDLFLPDSEITISMWVNAQGSQGGFHSRLYEKEGVERQLLAFQEDMTLLAFGLHIGGTYSELDVAITASDFENQWNHIVATYDGSTRRIFVNNVEVGSESISGTIGTNNTADVIFGSGGGTTEFFHGFMDDIRIYSHALSEFEIYSLYAENNYVNEDIISVDLVEQTGSWIDIYNNQVTITVPHATDMSSLAPVFGLPNGTTINPASGTARDFRSTQDYIVTTSSGESAVYSVNVIKEENTDDLAANKLIGDWSASADRAYFRLSSNTNPYQSIWFIPPSTIANQTCETDDIFTFNEDGSYVIQDQGQTWLVPIQTNDNGFGCGDPSTGVPYNEFVAGTYSYTADGTSITLQGQGAYLMMQQVFNDGSYPLDGSLAVQENVTYQYHHYEERGGFGYLTFKIRVNAENDNTWFIEMRHELLTDNDITSLSMPEQQAPSTIDETNHTVNLQVQFGTGLGSLAPEIMMSQGATIDPDPDTPQDFSTGSVIYTVTAQDGTSQDWTVSITEAPEFDPTPYAAEWNRDIYLDLQDYINGEHYGVVDYWHNERNNRSVQKFNEYGAIVWSTEPISFAGNGNGISFSELEIDADGNLYAYGRYSGNIEIDGTTVSAGTNDDLIIVKYDPDGNIIDYNRILGSAYMDNYGLIITSSGQIIISLFYDADFSFEGVNFSSASGNGVVIELASNLTLIQYDYQSFGRFTEAPDGRIFKGASGSRIEEISLSNLSVINTYNFPTDYFVHDHTIRIEADSQGDLVVGATEYSTQGTDQIFVGKFRPSTNEWLWFNTAGGVANEEFKYIGIDDSDNIYLSADYYNSWNWGGFTLSAYGDRDVLITKFSHSGEHLWLHTAGSSSEDRIYAMTVDKAAEDVIINGWFNGTDGVFIDESFSNERHFFARLSLEGPEEVPVFSAINGYGTSPGTGGTGFYYDGFDDGVTDEFSIEFLFKHQGFTGNGDYYNLIVGNEYFQLYLDKDDGGNENLIININDEDNSNDDGNLWLGTDMMNLGFGVDEWHFIAGTYTNSILTLYFDGFPVESVYFPWSKTTTVSNLRILENQDAAIDELRIWNRALTVEEIQSHANAELNAASTSDLQGYWRFNTVDENDDPDTTPDESSFDRPLNLGEGLINIGLVPPSLTLLSFGISGFEVSWTAVAAALGYDIQVSTNQDFTNIVLDTQVETTSYVVDGLNEQTTYYVRVRSRDGAGFSDWSDTLPVTTGSNITGLLAHYRLNTNGNDETGNNYNLTRYNFDGNIISFENGQGVDGSGSGSASFSGDGDYLGIDFGGGEWNSINNAITVNAWINPSVMADGDFGDIITYEYGNSGRLMLGTDGQLIYHWQDGDSSYPSVQSNTGLISTGNWYMVSYTIDNSNNLKVYLNGTEVASQNSINQWDQNVWRFTIASNETVSEDRFFNGLIDEVQVYNEALEVSQIQALYNEFVDDTEPPVVNISGVPNTYIIGSGGVNIAINVQDESDIQSVIAYVKGIADSEFEPSSPITLVDGSANQTINDNQFDEMGLEFYVIATDVAGNSNTIDVRRITAEYDGSGGSAPAPISGLKTGTESTDYSIVAYPFQARNISTAFPDLDQQSDESYRLARYNAFNGNYEYYPTQFNQLDPGRGYWFLSTSASSISIEEGTPVSANVDNPFEISLQAGWNMIGNPYLFSIDWSDVQAANNSVSGINSMTPRTYSNGYSSTSQIRRYQGFFVNAPTSMNLSIPVTAKSGSRVNSNTHPNYGVPGDGDWMVGFNVESGSLKLEGALIGMTDFATDKRDNYDWGMLPRMSSYLDISFDENTMRNLASIGDNYTWNMSINTNETGKKTKLTWNNDSFRDGLFTLLLVDTESGKTIDMSQSTNYSFTQTDEVKNFKVYYGPKNEVYDHVNLSNTQVGSLYPNPSAGEFKIPVYMTNDGIVSVRMLSLTGQLVYTEVFNADKGYRELNMVIDNTSKVPFGNYIVQISIETNKRTESFTKRLAYFK